MREIGVSETDGQKMKNSGKGKTSQSGVEAARKSKCLEHTVEVGNYKRSN